MVTVLIIDDSSFFRKRIRSMVAAQGHDTLEASDGRQGLEMITLHSPDCVLMDLLMPEMDGLELLEKLRENGSQIPVIVVTSDIQETTRAQCLELGAKTILNKPPKPAEICHAIDAVVGLKGEAIP